MRTDSVRMLEFAQHGDERGHLVVVEGMIHHGAAVARGCHANRRSEFVLINVAGQSKVRVRDGAGNEAVFSINRPHTGLYLPRMVWKDMYDFSPDSVLLVLSNEPYDAAEYIRDYDAFVREVNGRA